MIWSRVDKRRRHQRIIWIELVIDLTCTSFMAVAHPELAEPIAANVHVDGYATAKIVQVIQFLTGEFVGYIAVTFLTLNVKAHADSVVDVAADVAVGLLVVIVAVSEGQTRAECRCRLRCREIDDAARRVTAVERPLGTLENLDLAEIG